MRKGTGVERTRRGLARAACLLVTLAVLGSWAAADTYTVPLGTVVNTAAGQWVKQASGHWRLMSGHNGLMPDLPGAPPGLVKSPSLALARGNTIRGTITTVAKPVAGFGMRWGGAALWGPLLLTTALEYIYNSAQQSIHPDLDQWRSQQELNGFPALSGSWDVTGKTSRPTNQAEIAGATAAAGSGCSINNLTAEYAGSGPYIGVAKLSFNSVQKATSGYLEGYGTAAAAEAAARAALGVIYKDWVTDTGRCGVGAGVTSLADFLAGNEAAGQALDERMADYLDEKGADPAFPFTYQNPYGAGAGFELDEPPNINQWYGNPFADPTVDSDGDGWPDSQEAAAGTDPNDPNDYPSEAPFEDEDGNPLPDRDGDGIPDQYDPCPYQASNECADPRLPEDVATETTLREVRDALDDPGGTPQQGAFGDVGAQYDDWTPFPNTSTVWATAQGQVAADIAALQATLSGKIPFGFASWFPTVPAVGSGSMCKGFEVEIAAVETSIDICDNPLDAFMAGTGRSLLLALAYLGFVLTVVRRVQQA